MKLRDLIKKYPTIPWIESINIILAPITSTNEDELINVEVPDFIPKLINLLKRTPKRVQANCLLSKVVKGYVRLLNKAVRDKEFEFSSKLTGLFLLSLTLSL